MSLHGPCAKVRVQAVLIGRSGKAYVGENLCLAPQPVCPRLPGEGYEKCVSICAQLHHAEEQALRMAGTDARGGVMLVGYHYCCDACTEAMIDAGVARVVTGATHATLRDEAAHVARMLGWP